MEPSMSFLHSVKAEVSSNYTHRYFTKLYYYIIFDGLIFHKFNIFRKF